MNCAKRRLSCQFTFDDGSPKNGVLRRCTIASRMSQTEAVYAVSNVSEQISQGAVLLTVNQRLSRHHMMLYQNWQLQSGLDWWPTPEILPFRSWMSALHRQALGMGLSERTLVPALRVQQAWRRIIEADTSVQLLDPAGAARSALQAWELSCAWQCRNPEDQYLSADQFAWQRWMTRYRAWLDDQHGVDEPLLPDELIRILQSASAEQISTLLPDVIVLEGFLQVPAQFDQLLTVVQAHGVQVKINQPEAGCVVHTVSYADDDAELLGIAQQMRAELTHDATQSLGLVVPDLQQRRDAVVRAFERVFYPAMSPTQISQQRKVYEVSLGQSLAEQPVVAMALALLRLSAQSVSGNELSALVLSPYWKGAAAEIRRREQLDKRLRDKRVRSLGLDQFIDQMYPGSQLMPALKALTKKRNLRHATLHQWAARFSNWLDLLGWPGKSNDSEEYQAVSAWFECLDDMQLLDDGESLSFNSAFTQLKSLATDRVFQTQAPATPIQVIGRLESHGLDFDCLWVCGLDGEQWPPAGSASAFLSISEQKLCNVPNSSAAGRLALAESEFMLWAAHTPLLIGSRALSREGKELISAALPIITPSKNSEQLAQPIIARLEQLEEPVDLVRTVSQSLDVTAVDDYHGPELVAGTKAAGGARLFENQALCPFRAFALHRLNIRPLEEVGLGLDARQHGTLLHDALERFWLQVRTHEALVSMDESTLDELLCRVVQESMQELEVPDELRALELTRLTRLMHEWLTQCEARRSPFEVVEVERRMPIEHGGVLMEVIIDRIDKVDGALVVIDYKTGVNNKVNTWADQRISNPQLPLYVLTDEQISAASFAQVASNQCRFIGIASDEQTLPGVSEKLKGAKASVGQDEPMTSWPQWTAHWRTSLDAIAQELLHGTATVTPMKSACTYCELKSLCRIREDAELDGELSGAIGEEPGSMTGVTS